MISILLSRVGASSGKNKVVFAGNCIEDAAGGSGPDTIAGSVSNNQLVGGVSEIPKPTALYLRGAITGMFQFP
jgi:hypothetical protein